MGITAVRRTIATSIGSPVSTDDFLLGDMAAIARQSSRTDTQTLSGEVAAIFDRAVNFVIGTTEPTASNTGLVKESILTTYSGPSTITTPNTTITDKLIPFYMDIRADGFFMSNCKVIGPSTAPTGGVRLISFDNMPSGAHATIEDTELIPQQPSYYVAGITGRQFTAKRLKIHDTVDFFMVRNTASLATGVLDVEILGCYGYDHSYFSPDPNQPSDNQTHNDGVQLQGGNGSTSLFQGNAFWGREYSSTAGSGNAPDRGTGTIDNGRYAQGALAGIQYTSGDGAYTTGLDIFDNWLRGYERGLTAGSAVSTNIGRWYRNRFDDAQGERVGGSLSAGQGYAMRVDPTTTVDGAEGGANKNVYMAGLSGITAGSEVTLYRNG